MVFNKLDVTPKKLAESAIPVDATVLKKILRGDVLSAFIMSSGEGAIVAGGGGGGVVALGAVDSFVS